MNEQTTVEPAQGSNGKRGRLKQERKRRNFAAEVVDLQGRINMALKALSPSDGHAASAELVRFAVEILKGE